jgi:hypothetical protein
MLPSDAAAPDLDAASRNVLLQCGMAHRFRRRL